MKNPSILFILLAALVLAPFVSPTAATPLLRTAAAQGGPQPAKEYLLVLPMPDPRSLELSGQLSRDGARQAALAWARQQAGQAIDGLETLVAEGKISGFRFDEQEMALRVEVPADEDLETRELQALDNVSSVLGVEAASICSTGYDQALAELFFQQANQPAVLQAVAPTYDAPTIYAYAPVGTDWSSFYGYSAGATSLTMKILRGGTLLHTQTTTTDGDGVYEFYPTWQGGCEGSSYNWTLKAGDVVQVSSNGVTSSMVVDSLTGWIDPRTDVLTGTSSPAHTTRLSVWADRPNDFCNSDYYEIWTVTGGDGSFSGDFTPQADVDPSASGLVFVFDSNYNATYMWTYPFNLFVDPNDGSLTGSLLPNQAVDVQRVRDAVTLRFTTFSGPDGYIYSNEFDGFLPGDRVTVSSGTTAISYDVVDFSASGNAVSNLFSGSTASSRLVKITGKNHAANSSSVSTLNTACNPLDACTTLRSAANGSFSWTVPFDLRHGDAVTARVYDAAGNGQDYSYVLPLIAANPTANRILGYWDQPWADLTVKVADAGGVLKSSTPVQAWYDHSYDLDLGVDLAAGDQVTVTNDVITYTMTVQAVSAHLNSSSDTLSGSSAAGIRVLDFADYDPLTGSTTHVCTEGSTPGGNYSASLATIGVEALDTAEVSIRSGGHLTLADSHALQLDARLDNGTITGYTPLPGEAVTATLLTGPGGSVIETQSGLAGEEGAYKLAFNSGAFLSGQAIRLDSASETNTVGVSAVTINLDPATEGVSGQALPNRPAIVRLIQAIGCGGVCTRSLEIDRLANAAGAYAVSFQGWRWQDCTRAVVDGVCTVAEVEAVRGDEHSLSRFSPPPLPVMPDIYEDDNSVADAALYTGISQHTFHVELDVDWVAFNVTAADIGQVLTIVTINLGPLEDTKMILYDTDGGTILQYSDDGPSGVGSQILFTPDAAGTYYIKILPYSKMNNTGNCGAFYSFFIARSSVYLPLLRR